MNVSDLKMGLVAARSIGLRSPISKQARTQLARFVHPALKKLLDYSPSRKGWLQFSYLSRALEFPSHSLLESELEKFYERRCVDQNPELDPNWITRSLERTVGRLEPIPPSSFLVDRVITNASSYDLPRQKGGKIKEFYNTYLLDQGSKVIGTPDQIEDFITKVSKSTKVAGASAQSIRKSVNEFADDFPLKSFEEVDGLARCACLPERGKCRPVTMSNLHHGLNADWVGAQLRGKMKSFSSLVGSLGEDPRVLELVGDAFKATRSVPKDYQSKLLFPWAHPHELLLFSGDLRAATDLINKNLIDHCAQVLGLGENGYLAFSNKSFSFENNILQIQSGTCLGLGGSWPLLSIIHDLAIRRIGLIKGSYIIKGDDIIGYWTKKQIISYEYWITELTGMTLQHMKTYISARRALFCEKAFEISKEKSTVDFFTEVYTIKIRLERLEGVIPLSGITKDLVVNHKNQIEVLQAVEALGKERASRKMIRAVQLLNPLVSKLHKSYPGIAYLPSNYGGLGLLPPRQIKLTRYLAAYVRAVHNTKVRVPELTIRNKHSIQSAVNRELNSFFSTEIFLSPNKDQQQLRFEARAQQVILAERESIRNSLLFTFGFKSYFFVDVRFRDVRKRLNSIHKLSKTCSLIDLPSISYQQLQKLQDRIFTRRVVVKKAEPIKARPQRARRYS
jgi:hypothetical protein